MFTWHIAGGFRIQKQVKKLDKSKCWVLLMFVVLKSTEGSISDTKKPKPVPVPDSINPYRNIDDQTLEGKLIILNLFNKFRIHGI